MRVQKFTTSIADNLQRQGFIIDDDGEVARLAGEMALNIIHPTKSNDLWLEIVLPNGCQLETQSAIKIRFDDEDEEG
jgi:hypothetical protein